MRPAPADALRDEHERLCFARAFPRAAAERRRADRALARIEARVARLRGELANSGIAGTTYHYAYNYRTSQWLAATYGGDVGIDWTEYKRHEWDELASLLALLVSPSELDGVDDEEHGSWDWMREICARGRGAGRRGDLAWLLWRLEASGLDEDVRRHLYEVLDLPLRWDLAGCRDSITRLALPVRRIFTSREIITARPPDFRAAVREPLGRLEIVPPARADRYIRTARAALSLREREFHVIVHANREETYRTECGRGLEVITFGLPRAMRLPLEADYGCLLLRNGVPIGYAYGAVLFDRCDIGINIFPTYREGESAYTFTRVAALFHRHFGARDFVMRRYQVGHGNPEGIEAGSFWFYWKLGFRPVAPRVRRLAEAEAARLAGRRGARSDPAMLRRLARSDLVLRLDHEDPGGYRDFDVAAVGRAATRLIERRYGGDRRAAGSDCTRRVARALGVPLTGVPAPIAPIVTLVPGLDRWPADAKQALAAALRGKAARRERAWVVALLRAPRFRRFIEGF
jgi:hypothetical protein